jgi:lipopolysaccharide export system permease protein
VAQSSSDGQAIIGAKSSTDQGVVLNGVSIFTFDNASHYKFRIEARAAMLEPGTWRLLDARVYERNILPVDHLEYRLKTSLTPEQVRESFATPETVPFWELPSYINIAEQAGLGAAGYRLQFQKLLARPFLLTAMVFLAAAVSLRFFRFGGVQKMVLSGVSAGFLLYVLSKVTEDLSKAELMHPVAAAWLPVLAGGLTGFIALLYQEDG